MDRKLELYDIHKQQVGKWNTLRDNNRKMEGNGITKKIYDEIKKVTETHQLCKLKFRVA